MQPDFFAYLQTVIRKPVWDLPIWLRYLHLPQTTRAKPITHFMPPMMSLFSQVFGNARRAGKTSKPIRSMR